MTPPWTQNEIIMLRQLWNESKLSAGQIGKKLGRSRNSVIGKAGRDPACKSRLGRMPYNLKAAHKPAKKKPEKTVTIRNRPGRPRKVYDVPAPDTVRAIPFRDTERGDCMFILDRQNTCCGNEAMQGKAWCEYHFNVTHERKGKNP